MYRSSRPRVLLPYNNPHACRKHIVQHTNPIHPTAPYSLGGGRLLLVPTHCREEVVAAQCLLQEGDQHVLSAGGGSWLRGLSSNHTTHRGPGRPHEMHNETAGAPA